MKITLLGTGSPLPDPNRAGPSTLVQDEGTTLLFDAGRGVLMRLAATGCSPLILNAVLLTHLHSDHITDLNDVITTHWIYSQTPTTRAAKADLDALAAGEAGTLRIGSFQSASARILPAVLARFRERWPNISVSLTGQPLEHDLGAMVRNGLLDLAFIDVSTVEAPLAAVELLVDPYVVLLPASSPLASRPALDLAELGDYDLISGAMDDPCSARLNQAFGALDRQPNIVFRTDDNLTIQRLVGVGLGGAVVANLTVEPQIDGPRVVRVPLAPTSRIERRIGIVWHSGRYQSRAATAFVEEARAVCAELGGGALAE